MACSVAREILTLVDQSQDLSDTFNPRELLIIGVGGSVLRTCPHSARKPEGIDLGMIIKPVSAKCWQRERVRLGNAILFEPVDRAAVTLLKKASQSAWVRCSNQIIEKFNLPQDFKPGVGGIAFVTPSATTLGSVDPPTLCKAIQFILDILWWEI